MNNNLNLITTEEKFEQKTSLIFKILNIFFIVSLIAATGFSIYSFIEFNKLKQVENNLKLEKDGLLTQVASYSNQEQLIRAINHRFSIYKNFHDQIEDSSEIVREIYARALGTSVEIMNINFSYENKEVEIRVKSNSEQFTRFVNNLKNEDFKNPESRYPSLFFPSPKNEEVDQAIREYIVFIKYRPEVLKNE